MPSTRHVDVEEDGIRPVSATQVDGFLTVGVAGGGRLDVGQEIEERW